LAERLAVDFVEFEDGESGFWNHDHHHCIDQSQEIEHAERPISIKLFLPGFGYDESNDAGKQKAVAYQKSNVILGRLHQEVSSSLRLVSLIVHLLSRNGVVVQTIGKGPSCSHNAKDLGCGLDDVVYYQLSDVGY
jgi:hypothetical protein